MPAGVPFLAIGLVFLVLAVATTSTWEPCHDEGVTFDQAVGRIGLEAWPGAPVAIDELCSNLAGEDGVGPAAVARALHGRGMHPPAYYILVNRWVSWFGSGRISLRVPAYGLGLLSLLGIGWIARRTVPVPWAGEWAALLLATSPWFQGITTYARPYGAMIALSLGSTAVLLGLGSGGERLRTLRGYAAFAALSVCGLYTLYHYVFVLAAQMLVLLGMSLFAAPGAAGERRSARSLGALVALAAVIALGFAAWLPALERHLSVTGGSSWYFTGAVSPADLPYRLFGLLRRFGLGSWSAGARWPLATHAFLVLSAVTAALLVASFVRPGALRGDRGARWFWWLAPLQAGAIYASDLWRDTHTLFVSKVAAGLFPLVLVAVVRAWSWLPGRTGSVGLGVWALLFASVTLGEALERGRYVSGYEALAAHVRDHDDAGHLVALSAKGRGALVPLALLLRRAGVEHARATYVRGPELAEFARAALEGDALTRLTLVQVEEGKPAAPEWAPDELERIEQRATGLGWSVVALGGGPPASSPGRTLTVARGVAVRFRDD